MPPRQDRGSRYDICLGGNDALDADADGVPDFCDACPGFDDVADVDADGIGDVCDGCCIGLTGNVNGDEDENVNLTDLTVLVNHLFVTFEPLSCPAEANTSGDLAGDLSLIDLTVLVNHLFVTFDPLPACP